MYLEIFQYDPNDHQQINGIQQEIRDFKNKFPEFEIESVETFLINDLITIHFWYAES